MEEEIKKEPEIKIEPQFDDYIEEKSDMYIKSEDVKSEVIVPELEKKPDILIKIEDDKQEVTEPEVVVIKIEQNHVDIIGKSRQPSNSTCDNSSQIKGNNTVNFAKKCFICNVILLGKNIYLKHMLQHKKLKKCKFCPKTFDSTFNYRKHIRQCTLNRNAPVPSKILIVEVKSEDEMENNVKKSVWQCGECKMYVSGENKIRHLLSHDKQKCLLCGLRFFLEEDLRVHTEKVHQTNLTVLRGKTCYICKEPMSTRKEFFIHLKENHKYRDKFYR